MIVVFSFGKMYLLTSWEVSGLQSLFSSTIRTWRAKKVVHSTAKLELRSFAFQLSTKINQNKHSNQKNQNQSIQFKQAQQTKSFITMTLKWKTDLLWIMLVGNQLKQQASSPKLVNIIGTGSFDRITFFRNLGVILSKNVLSKFAGRSFEFII
jgi:hypothetical protein